MMTDVELLRLIQNNDFETLFRQVDMKSASMIKSKIQEIPQEFFEPRIEIDEEGNKISFIQFSMETARMPMERKTGLMEKYNIDPYDMKKLQGIIDSIKVVKEYGTEEVEEETVKEEDGIYGFSLASDEKINKAYPLWLAYLYASSKDPFADISAKLKEDGMDEKYDPQMIVGLIRHTNSIMKGKTEEEKKDFYVHSISGILEEQAETIRAKDSLEI